MVIFLTENCGRLGTDRQHLLFLLGIPFHKSTQTKAITTKISWRSSGTPGYSTDGITNYATITYRRRHFNSPLTYALTVDNITFWWKTLWKIHHLQDTSTDERIILRSILRSWFRASSWLITSTY
jgi:hypothetical protein